MFNFALASTTAVVWCFAAYVRCERFNNWRWSLTFGIAFAALILSRSVAPAYAIPLVLVLAVDLVIGARRLGTLPGRPALGAAAIVVVVAGPWWAISGHALWHYLTYAGYQSSSGYTSRGLSLTPASVVDRVKLELMSPGWAESVLIGLLVVAALVQVVRDRRARQLNQLWVLAAWVVVALLVLSSSGNQGTAFGLPLLAVTIVACAVVLGGTVEVGRRVFPAILVVLLCVGAASQFTSSRSFWWHGPPYRLQVLAAGGSTRTNVDALTASVAQALPAGNAISVLNSPIINDNSLAWYERPSTHILPIAGSDSTRSALSLLSSARSLVTGSALGSYNFSLDQSSVEREAFRTGYRPTRVWNASKIVTVVVWERGAKALRAAVLPPVVRVVKPSSGSVLTGQESYLVASVSDVLGVSHATFEIRGATLAHPVTTAAAASLYGWISILKTGTLAKGTYTITCTAENVTGAKSTSKPIVMKVER
jgi:hypothetical protein